MPSLTVVIEGQFYWNLIYSDKNSTSDSYKASYETERRREASKKEIIEHVEEKMSRDSTTNDKSISAGGKILGVELSAERSWENTKEIVDTIRTTTTSENDVTIKDSVTLKREYDMKPGQSLFVYQRVFSSPGATFQQDIYQHLDESMPEADQIGKVELKYVVAQAVYISGIQVVYGPDDYMAPVNRVKEGQGRKDDINADTSIFFPGTDNSLQHVWLVPKYTADEKKAITSIKFVQTNNKNSDYDDLAAGTDRKYRYLIPEVDVTKSRKISKLDLWRFWAGYDPALDRITSDDWTEDINKDRTGDFLYLGWDYYVNPLIMPASK
ncbi:hypothetical protein VKT23_001496 [Stygiomarasmius scandens]|uniref:Uncharacterized protein n=1 Tax=Marasmiellus scandens TaxID=2682957 RepID=A0ABR1K4L5_9AGAR